MFTLDSWSADDYDNLTEYLKSNADLKYRDFFACSRYRKQQHYWNSYADNAQNCKRNFKRQCTGIS